MSYRDDLEAATRRGEHLDGELKSSNRRREELEDELRSAEHRVAELEAKSASGLSPQLEALRQEAQAKRDRTQPSHRTTADVPAELKRAPVGPLVALHCLSLPAAGIGMWFGVLWVTAVLATVATTATIVFLYREAGALRGRTAGVSLAARKVPCADPGEFSVVLDYSYEVAGRVQTGACDVTPNTRQTAGGGLDDLMDKYAAGNIVQLDYHLERPELSRLHKPYSRHIFVALSLGWAIFNWALL